MTRAMIAGGAGAVEKKRTARDCKKNSRRNASALDPFHYRTARTDRIISILTDKRLGCIHKDALAGMLAA
jgi:hypothetical protein